jgi:hypothetical protein
LKQLYFSLSPSRTLSLQIGNTQKIDSKWRENDEDEKVFKITIIQTHCTHKYDINVFGVKVLMEKLLIALIQFPFKMSVGINLQNACISLIISQQRQKKFCKQNSAHFSLFTEHLNKLNLCSVVCQQKIVKCC